MGHVENASCSSHYSGDMPPSTAHLAACDKGRSLFDKLNSFETTNLIFQSLDLGYSLEQDTLRRNVPGYVESALARFGIGLSHVEYAAAVPRVMAESNLIYLNWFDAGNGVVIANMNNKTNDDSPADERLFPSEILWQSWCRVSSRLSIPVSNLRVIVRLFVVNEESKRVIEETLLHSSCTREETTHCEYTDGDEGFYALLGSINGASSMRMLIDHREALGFRTVERVVVLRNEVLDGGAVPSPTFMILLSSRRAVETDNNASVT